MLHQLRRRDLGDDPVATTQIDDAIRTMQNVQQHSIDHANLLNDASHKPPPGRR